MNRKLNYVAETKITVGDEGWLMRLEKQSGNEILGTLEIILGVLGFIKIPQQTIIILESEK